MTKHADFDSIGRYATLTAAQDLLAGDPVDALVCDLHLPDGMAVPLIRPLTAKTETKVVVYTANVHPVISSICETAARSRRLLRASSAMTFCPRSTRRYEIPVERPSVVTIQQRWTIGWIRESPV